MSEPALRDTFGDFLVEMGKKNNDIVVLDADLSSSTRTNTFAKAFPKRFFNMGIAEQNMLGTALGFAISGKIPIVSGFTIFTTGRAWEFIRMACHDRLNVKIITTHSGFVGEDGSTHNSLEDICLMATLQNLTVLVPIDNIELQKMLKTVIDSNGPFYVRLPRDSFPTIHDENYRFKIGKSDILKDGNDICLIGTGYGSSLAYFSAPQIEEELECSIKVINLSTIKPIDKNQLIKEVKDMKGIVIIEEHNLYCGFGSILARIISEKYPIQMKFIGVNNTFGQSGKRKQLLDLYGLNYDNIKKQIQDLLKSISV